MDEKQTLIKDLEIEPLPMEQVTFFMLRSWPSCQSIIRHHGISASANSSLHQTSAFLVHSWYKVESINLTNNSGSQCRLLNTIYYTYSFPIITTRSKCIRLANARKFGSEYLAVRQPLYRQERKFFGYQPEYNPYKYQALLVTEYE